jgi:hypothetical protein
LTRKNTPHFALATEKKQNTSRFLMCKRPLPKQIVNPGCTATSCKHSVPVQQLTSSFLHVFCRVWGLKVLQTTNGPSTNGTTKGPTTNSPTPNGPTTNGPAISPRSSLTVLDGEKISQRARSDFLNQVTIGMQM